MYFSCYFFLFCFAWFIFIFLLARLSLKNREKKGLELDGWGGWEDLGEDGASKP